jgi:predicted RNase H-like HicB family nuclease
LLDEELSSADLLPLSTESLVRGKLKKINWRNSAMSSAAIPAAPVSVDVTVTLTAIVRAEPDVGGYSASIPALPGCHTQGETLDDIRANLREAAEGWLAVAHEDALARDSAGGAS